MRKLTIAFAAALVSMLATGLVPEAQATFPGTNGKLALQSFNFGDNIRTVNPNGTGDTGFPIDGGCRNDDPVWSPDATRIAYEREYPSPACNGDWDIAIMNADGTGTVLVSGAASGVPELDPAWSPDGSKIAFVKNDAIYTIAADGSGTTTQLTTGASQDQKPDWSPDGSTIAFQRFDSNTGDWDLYGVPAAGGTAQPILATIAQEENPSWSPGGTSIAYSRWTSGSNADIYTLNRSLGTSTNITNTSGQDERWPVYSPDGKQIAFFNNCCDIQKINTDGTGRATVATNGIYPDWQRLANYVRPTSATPTSYRLVPAFKSCTSPNGVHDSPYAGSSCVPPVPASDYLTVGTADYNGAPTKSTGLVKVQAIPGDLSTPADEADLSFTVNITDVRNKSDLSDYTGSLLVAFDVKRTDKRNRLTGTSSYVLGGTEVPFPLSFPVACAATADTTVGGTCSVTTSADSLAANLIAEGKRTIWQMNNLLVYDGGSDGNAATGPNTLFEEVGNFIP